MMYIGASYVPGNVSNQPNDTKQLYVNDYSRKDNIAAYDGVWIKTEVNCTVIESNQVKAEQLKHN